MSLLMVDTICPDCGAAQIDALIRGGVYPRCACGGQTERWWISCATVRPDSIPGGLTIEHGLCHPDGTPRTYYSQSEITAECEKRGLTRWTDVYTEDKTKDARVRADWYQSPEAKRAKALRDEARAEKQLEKAKAAAEVTA